MAGQGYQRSTLYQPSGGDAGGAAVQASLSQRLQDFAAIAQGVHEQTAVPAAQAAGTEAAQAGNTNLRRGIGNVDRAYNEAVIRAYSLDAYADINQKMSEYEIAAGTDVNKFRSLVQGYRAGTMPKMLPAAQPLISSAMQQREAEGMQRIGALAATEGKAEAVAMSERGLTALEENISQLYVAGDPASMARAQALTGIYMTTVDGHAAGGLYTPREAEARKLLMTKNVTRNVAIGHMEAELDKPGGDPVKVIQDTMDHASSALSADEQQALVGDLIQRLNVHQALVSEAAQQETLGLKAQWDAGEKEATHLLLTGGLTMHKIDALLQSDRLDPNVARSLRSALKEGGGGVSDQKTKFIYETNLLDYTDEDIRDEPSLSWADKSDIIIKRRQLEGGWQDTNPAQEARSRIDNELGIVPGSIMATLSDETKLARGRALKAWYDEVDGLPPDQRLSQAIPIAEKVIDTVIRKNVNTQVSVLERRKRDYIAGAGPVEKMSKTEKMRFDEAVKALDDAIARERGKTK